MKSTLVHVHSQLPKHRRATSAFTLIELLTVIAILVLLVALTVGILRNAQVTAVRKKAEGQLELLKTGLTNYNNFYNEYPEPIDNTGEGADGSKALYQALSGDGDNYLVTANAGTASTGVPESTGEIFIEGLDPNNNKHGLLNSDYELVDPYGQRWRYRKDIKEDSDEINNKGSYDLWSVGEDRKELNEAKWIKNW